MSLSFMIISLSFPIFVSLKLTGNFLYFSLRFVFGFLSALHELDDGDISFTPPHTTQTVSLFSLSPPTRIHIIFFKSILNFDLLRSFLFVYFLLYFFCWFCWFSLCDKITRPSRVVLEKPFFFIFFVVYFTLSGLTKWESELVLDSTLLLSFVCLFVCLFPSFLDPFCSY